jgi:SH3-like domain-containing protein
LWHLITASSFKNAFVFPVLLGLLVAGSGIQAAEAPPSAPFEAKYEALRFGKIKMHTGPGQQYPVSWVYQRKGLPVKVVAAYDVWRKVVDADGTTGWMQENMLSDKRTVAVVGVQRHLMSDASPNAATVALADPGTIAQVKACKGGWCQVKFTDYEGWIRQSEVWGTAPNETFGPPQ